MLCHLHCYFCYQGSTSITSGRAYKAEYFSLKNGILVLIKFLRVFSSLFPCEFTSEKIAVKVLAMVIVTELGRVACARDRW